MTLRITVVIDDGDKDDLHIIFNRDRGTAQVIATDRQGTVSADRVRPLPEVVGYLRTALQQKERPHA